MSILRNPTDKQNPDVIQELVGPQPWSAKKYDSVENENPALSKPCINYSPNIMCVWLLIIFHDVWYVNDSWLYVMISDDLLMMVGDM